MKRINYIRNLENRIVELIKLANTYSELYKREHFTAERRLSNMKLINIMMTEVIKAERNEESLIRKFNTVEELAKEMKMLMEIEIDYSERKDK